VSLEFDLVLTNFFGIPTVKKLASLYLEKIWPSIFRVPSKVGVLILAQKCRDTKNVRVSTVAQNYRDAKKTWPNFQKLVSLQ